VEEAIDDFTRALELHPGDADLVQNLAQLSDSLAWVLVTAPPAGRAVHLAPGNKSCLNTLGVAPIARGTTARPSRRSAAASRTARGAGDGFDLFALVMARYKLGQVEAACADFSRAGRWTEGRTDLSPHWSRGLKAFRGEAEAVLPGPPGELPVDVFSQ
jgi:hypothetical protein